MWMIFGQLHTEKCKATENQIVKLQLNEKKSKESQTRLMCWYWKRRPTWRKHLITCDSHSWIMFSLTDWLYFIIWSGGEGRGLFQIGHPRSRVWKNYWRRWTRGMGDLENWTIFMDVIYVSSLKNEQNGCRVYCY